MTRKRTATERLAEAHAEHAATQRHIGEIEQRRRAALLADADGAAAVADDELFEVRALAKRLTDKIALLEPLAGAEQCDTSTLPNDPAEMQRLLAHWESRQRHLERLGRLNRSAADDAELDSVSARIPYLKQRINLWSGLS